eukprot:29330-Pelagococcus_subviridis.AAC.4
MRPDGRGLARDFSSAGFRIARSAEVAGRSIDNAASRRRRLSRRATRHFTRARERRRGIPAGREASERRVASRRVASRAARGDSRRRSSRIKKGGANSSS